MLEKKHLLKLGLVSLVAITAGAVIGLALNYRTIRNLRSPRVESSPSVVIDDEEENIATFSGTIKPLSPSVYPKGTHFLEGAAGEVIAILKGVKIDLSFFEGQTVEVEGTIKGNILEVEKIIL